MKKNTSRALLMSFLSLFLCVTMLLGTTFAWFTDEVTSTNNIIKSGTLDVEFEYSTDMADWKVMESSSNVFKEGALWEPGYSEVVYLRVTNKGDLALKYLLKVNIAEETKGTNHNDEEFSLSDYIQYGVVATDAKYTSREDAVDAVTAPVALNKDFGNVYEMKNNGDVHTYALIAYMPEEVGNVANHKPGAEFKPEIKLGVGVYATQLTHENDSFDNLYDDYSDFETVTDVADMKASIEKAIQNGETEINLNFLGEEINLNYGLSQNLVPEGTTVTIANADVNGTSYGNGVNGTLIFNNCTFTNTGAYSIHFDNGTGDVIFNNCILEGWCSFGASINSVTMNDCTLRGNGTYAMARFYQNAELNNCTIECSNANLEDKYSDGISAINPETAAADEAIVVNLNNCNIGYADFECHNDGIIKVDGISVKNDIKVATTKELQSALDTATDGTVITLTDDIDEATPLNIAQNHDTKIVINGGGNKYKGSLTIDGKSAAINSSGIVIKNIVFDSSTTEYDACIRLGASGDTTTRYTNNVTIEGCTFIGDGSDEKVAIKSYTGGDKNLTVKNCVATDMHSLLQLANVENVTVEKCTVTGKRGFSVGASTNVQVSNTTINATSYGIRSEGREIGGSLTIADCNITANIPVVIRKVSKDYAVTFNGKNTMNQNNTEGLWCVAATNEYGDVDKAGLTPVTAKVTVTLNDTSLDSTGVFVKE